jgi:hypothetical protein
MFKSPQCRFYQFHKKGRAPQKADRFSAGTLPMRAARYCDAITTASGFGWWLFPPAETFLMWDGHSIVWSTDCEGWQIVNDVVHFPGFPEDFDTIAPDGLRGKAPPFLTALPEPGLIQVSFGLFARTAPGWSMLIRRPANFPLSSSIDHYEGVLNTSTWFGPLFINLRLTKTDFPIRLRPDMPLGQAQPIPRALLVPSILEFKTDLPSLNEWEDYRTTIVEPNNHPDRAFGSYAAEQRRNRVAAL